MSFIPLFRLLRAEHANNTGAEEKSQIAEKICRRKLLTQDTDKKERSKYIYARIKRHPLCGLLRINLSSSVVTSTLRYDHKTGIP